MYNQPRPVSSATTFELFKKRAFPILFGLLFSAIPVVVIGFIVVMFIAIQGGTKEIDYDRIDQSGQVAVGVITDIETQYNTKVNNQHPSVVTYKYTHDGVERIAEFRTLSPHEVSRLSVGDEIQVKYLGDDSVIVGLRPLSFPITLLTRLMIIFPIIGSPFLFYGLFKLMGDVKLYKHGNVVDATILSMIPLTRRLDVQYRYKTSNGREMLGRTLTNDYLLINDKKPGDTVKVFVSPGNESKSCLVPRMEALRNRWNIQGL